MKNNMKNSNPIFTVTGPSGSGKDSVVNSILYICGEKSAEELGSYIKTLINKLDELKNKYPIIPLKALVSHTTRAPRNGEIHGKTYYYVSLEEFSKLEKIEETEYAGNHYCLSANEVNNVCKNHPAMVIVDIEGVKQIKDFHDNVISIFIETSEEIITKRMLNRGDSEEKIKERLLNAKNTNEYDNGKNCDITIRNDNLIEAVETVYKIILEKCN